MSSPACSACPIGRASTAAGCPFREVSWPAGTLLVRQGEPPPAVWYIRAGTVELTSSTPDGDETGCALRGPGATLGLEALTGGTAGYEAWAVSQVALCRLGADAFRAWVGGLATPAGAVAALALDEAERRHRERVALKGQAHQRVARFLLDQVKRSGSEQALRVEQQLLARTLSMRPETLSRALARLRRLGALAPGRRLKILDVEALALAAYGASR